MTSKVEGWTKDLHKGMETLYELNERGKNVSLSFIKRNCGVVRWPEDIEEGGKTTNSRY